MTQDEKTLRRKLKSLEEELALVIQERDELTRDLENLCLSSGGSTTFSSSSVLSERIYSTEKELSRCKEQLRLIIADRDSLKEDLGVMKEAKRQGDSTLKQQLDKNTTLDRELTFYQQQAAKVMADRDKSNWEAEELRSQNLQLDSKLREASSRAETEGAQRRQLESQVEFLKQRTLELERKAAEAAVVPSLKLELSKAAQQIGKMQKCQQQLQDEARNLERQLGEAKGRQKAAEVNAADTDRKLAAESAARSEEEARLRVVIAELKRECETMHGRWTAAQRLAEDYEHKLTLAEHDNEEITQQKANEQSELQKKHKCELDALKLEHNEQVEQLQQQVTAAEAALADAQGQIEEVMEQKVAALMRQSTAETAKSKADASIERLMRDLATIRNQLDQATKEKVEALLQIADLREEAEATKSVGRTDSAASEDGKSSPNGAQSSGKSAPAATKGWLRSPLRG